MFKLHLIGSTIPQPLPQIINIYNYHIFFNIQSCKFVIATLSFKNIIFTIEKVLYLA